MAISIEEVKKIAALARIKLTPAEEKRHSETISEVLEYMKILNEVDTSLVDETYQVTGLSNVYRNDIVVESIKTVELISQMPQTENSELVVPEVFSQE